LQVQAAMPRKAVAPGRTLGGRFFLLEEISKSRSSTVFKGKDLRNDGQTVAVKVPLGVHAGGISRARREAEIGAVLDHPSVVRFVPVASGDEAPLVVTEYVVGTTLADRLAHERPMAEADALRIAAQLCEAVDYLHRQAIVHYDLQPSNVLLTADGSLRLIGFGSAHAKAKQRSVGGSIRASFAISDYAAPEQVRGRRGQPSVDIYAVGAILYEMLTGHVPFEGDDPFGVTSPRRIADPKPPRALHPAISAQAEEAVLRALRRDPAERYPTATSLQFDLEHISTVRVSGLADRLIQVTRKRKALLWIGRIAAVGIVPHTVFVAVFFVLWWLLARRR
jgi:serine/threonine-protein kinase